MCVCVCVLVHARASTVIWKSTACLEDYNSETLILFVFSPVGNIATTSVIFFL